MLVLAGTYPGSAKLLEGYAECTQDWLVVGDKRLGISCGTTAMMAAAAVVCRYLDIAPPFCVLSCDVGEGIGSEHLYSYLSRDVFALEPEVLTLHYMMPLIEGVVDFAFALEECGLSPVLVADAGGMYAAKIAGLSPLFDLFTPDMGELAFLADEEAAHPLFVKEALYGFPEERVLEFAEELWSRRASPEMLLVKGSTDYIIRKGSVVGRVDEPNLPAMEAVGGTGDVLTGIVSALLHSGIGVAEACYLAAVVNRVAGRCCGVQPDTRVSALIGAIPRAIDLVWRQV